MGSFFGVVRDISLHVRQSLSPYLISINFRIWAGHFLGRLVTPLPQLSQLGSTR